MAELDDRGRDAADGLLAKVTAVARAEAARAVAEKLNNVVEGGRLNWDMLTQWGHHLLDNGTEVPIRPKLDLVGFTVADVPAGDLTRVTGGGGGGGTGGWSLVERLTVSSPTDDLAFTTVPSSGDMLMLVSQGSSIVATGQTGALYGLLLNGDLVSGSAKYRDLFTEVDGYPSSVSSDHFSTFHDTLGTIGTFGASLSGATADNGGGVSVCYIPGFTVAKPITAISHSQNYHQNLTSFGTGAKVIQGTYTFTYDDNGPLTALHVHCGNGGQFAVGTTFSLYVLNGGGTGGGATALARCQLTRTTNLTMAAGSYTTVSWDSEREDVSGFHSTGTNPDRVTVTEAGLYLLEGRFRFHRVTGTTTSQRIWSAFFKNDTVTINSEDWFSIGQASSTTGPDESQFSMVATHRLAAGDYVNVQMANEGNGTVDLVVGAADNQTCEFVVTRIGG